MTLLLKFLFHIKNKSDDEESIAQLSAEPDEQGQKVPIEDKIFN